MDKTYDNEATHYEETSLVTQESANSASQENNQMEEPSQKKGWRTVAMGAITGIVAGGVSSVLMGMTTPDTPHKKTDDGGKTDTGGKTESTGSQPDWVDDKVQVATTVNDDMSFGEAFASARKEVGPGGVFEWHGQIYNTYTAEEWNGMTAEERTEFGNHFDWNQIDHSNSDVAQHSTTAGSTTTSNTQNATTDDDIEVVSVTHDESDIQATTIQAGYTDTGAEDTEVQVLGVVHDAESGMNVAGLNVYGEEVILVDVDGDIEFDYMASDVNGNEVIEENELYDIQGEHLTVDDLGGFTNDPTGNMLASNSGPDYVAEVYEG